ncbi:POZ [Glarea lozoyensis ATCC 20868]|uniref:POZ n=1 Tax=Glarea lozoyensis (strain ATCC 20868 / MF5171) TaxID=1116229 RepID=S3DZR6_GLAL2|nr:POZ [Glarea lozoyensis ATCC 20868]EPE31778.1 POZ [Glarea lozoyensis ATCC 20868]
MKVKEELLDRKDHGMDVHTLITGSSEKITLAVGEKAKPISCHKALLGFFSKFFESALYGSFAEASQTEMRLPEDDPELMSEFVAWLYSGQSPSQIDLEEEEYCEQEPEPAADCILVREDIEREMRMLSLWILADKLGSPRLANNTMRCILHMYQESFSTSFEAELVFNNTAPGSKLRLLFRDIIAADGPLLLGRRGSGKEHQDKSESERWLLLLAKGGDLVKDCVMTGFTTPIKDYEEQPFCTHNRGKYIEKIESKPSAKDWLKQKHPPEVADEPWTEITTKK